MYELSESTIALSKTLHKVRWFSALGAATFHSMNITGQFVQCLSWKEAIQAALNLQWEVERQKPRDNLLKLVLAHISVEVQKSAYEKCALLAEEIFSQKILPQVSETILPERVKQNIISDIAWVLLEKEFKAFLEQENFNGFMFWYYMGHFPCGLLENEPSGKISVF